MPEAASHPSAKVFDCGSHSLLFLRDQLELRLLPADQVNALQQALRLYEEPVQLPDVGVSGRTVLVSRLRHSVRDEVLDPVIYERASALKQR